MTDELALRLADMEKRRYEADQVLSKRLDAMAKQMDEISKRLDAQISSARSYVNMGNDGRYGR